MKRFNLTNTKFSFRKFIAASLVLLSFLTVSFAVGQIQPSASQKNSSIIIDGRTEKLPAEINMPYICEDADDTMAPIKNLSKALGYNLNWKNFDLDVNLTYAKNSANNASNKKANKAKGAKQDPEINVNSVGDSKVFMKKLNDYRASKSIGVVKEDEKLNKLALLRAQEEVEKFINTGDGDHNSPGGYNNSLGENLALSYYSVGIVKGDVNEDSLTRWIKSPGHKANLLNKDCKKGGYACARKIVDNKVYESSIYLFGY